MRIIDRDHTARLRKHLPPWLLRLQPGDLVEHRFRPACDSRPHVIDGKVVKVLWRQATAIVRGHEYWDGVPIGGSHSQPRLFKVPLERLSRVHAELRTSA